MGSFGHKAALLLLVGVLHLVVAFPSLAQAPAQITQVQRHLSQLNYDPGPADGKAGAKSMAAIEAFASKRGVASWTWSKILSLLEEEVRTKLVGKQSPNQLVVQAEPNDNIYRLQFSPDGSLLLTSNAGAFAELWDTATGTKLRSFRQGTNHSSTFIGDGAKVATASFFPGDVKVWDTRTGELLATWIANEVGLMSMRSTSDGTLVLAGIDGRVTVWTPGGRLLRTIYAHSQTVDAMAVSRDDRYMATSSSDRTLKLWDLVSGELVAEVESLAGAQSFIEFSSDGALLASSSMLKGDPVVFRMVPDLRITSSDTRVAGAADGRFHPDGKSFFAFRATYGGMEPNSPKMSKFQFPDETSEERIIVPYNSQVFAMDLSPDGRVMATSVDDQIWLWDTSLPFNKPKMVIGGNVLKPVGMSVSDRGGVAVVSFQYGGGAAWDLDKGQLLAFADYGAIPTSAFRGSTFSKIHSGEVLSLLREDVQSFLPGVLATNVDEYTGEISVGPGGEVAAVALTNGKVRLVELASGAPRTIKSNVPYVDALALSPDGRTLLIGGDSTIEAWDTTTLRHSRSVHLQNTDHADYKNVDALAFSTDGTVFASSSWGAIEVFETSSGDLKQSFAHADSWSNALAFSPDGQLLASAGDIGTINVWDLRSGELRASFATDARATELAFSDESRLIVANHQGLIIWDLGLARMTAQMIAFEPREHLREYITVTPSGLYSGSDNAGRFVAAVRGLEFAPLQAARSSLSKPKLVAELLSGDPNGLYHASASGLDVVSLVASGAAPRTDLELAEVNQSAAAVVQVKTTVEGTNGGIGKVVWRVNGVTVGVENLADQTGLKTFTDVRELELSTGLNQIEVVAYNQGNLVGSLPATLTVERSAPPPREPKLFVLTVGVNEYWDSRLRLKYAATDAKAVATMFGQAGRGLYGDVVVRSLLDDDVIETNLEQAFTDIGKEMLADDVFVLFIAGHGKTVNSRYYFIPADFRYENDRSIETRGIGEDKFQEWLAKVPAQKSVLLYDTCESGTLTMNQIATRGIEQAAALARMTQAMGRTVLSASTDDAPALEGYKGHGVFTYALLEAISTGDANNDGFVEVTELAGEVDRLVPQFSVEAFEFRQVPQMSIVGSSFPLVASIDRITDDEETEIPIAPTHVVIKAAGVSKEPAGVRVRELGPGTQVRVVSIDGELAQVARNGEFLGYVSLDDLAPLQ